MNKLITRIKRLALALCLATPIVSWAVSATEYTGTLAPWNYSTVYAWGADGNTTFHSGKVIPINADGTDGTAMMNWNYFCSGRTTAQGYTTPAPVLYFRDAQSVSLLGFDFDPVTLGGIYVASLASSDAVYTFGDSANSSGNSRRTEFGYGAAETYFKFEKSFNVSRKDTTTFIGVATVEIASGATFAAAKSGVEAKVAEGSTLKLIGDADGTLAVPGGLTVKGELDLSATPRPTISGNVTCSTDTTIRIPEGATSIEVCSGTLSLEGGYVNIAVGTGDAQLVEAEVSGGAITSFEVVSIYHAAVAEDVNFSEIAWDGGLDLADATAETLLQLEIADGVTVTLDTDLSLGAFTVEGEGAVVVDGTRTITVALDAPTTYIDSSLTVPSGAMLKTNGALELNDLYVNYGGTLEVISGTLSADTTVSNYSGGFAGTFTIDAGATFVNKRTDVLSREATAETPVRINVYGTLSFGSTRWTMRGATQHILNLYQGAAITGAGDGEGVIDFEDGGMINAYNGESAGTITISGPVKFRSNASTPIWVGENTTLVLANGTKGSGYFSKSGEGTLKFVAATTGSIAHTGDNEINYGTVLLSNIGATLPIRLNNNNSVLAVEATTRDVTVNATALTSGGTVDMTTSGSYKVKGTITVPALPTGTFKTDLGSKWAGQLVIDGLTDSGTHLEGLGNNITLNNYTGYLYATANMSSVNLTVTGTFSQTDGWSSPTNVKLASLAGNGTMTDSTVTTTARQVYDITTMTDFTGTINFTKGSINVSGNASLTAAQTISTFTVGGTLTVNGGSLTGNLSANNVAVTTEEEIVPGLVLVPVSGTVAVSGTVTVNGDDVEVECVEGEGIKVATPAPTTVTVTVPVVANTTVTVTAGGETVEPDTEGGNVYTVDYGSAVVVTYTVDGDAYSITGGTIEFTATEDKTVAEPTVAAYKAVYEGTKYTAVEEALGLAYHARPASFGKVITVLDSAYEDTGLYDDYGFEWDGDKRTYTVITYPARIAATYYPSLAAAVTAATDGNIIVLVADDRVSFANIEVNDGVPSGGSIVIDKNITIDGNGFKVYGNSNAEILNATGSATPGYDMAADLVDGTNLMGFFVKSGNVTFTNVTLTEFGDTAYVNKFGYTPIQTASAYEGALTLTNVNFSKFNRTAVCVRGGTLSMTGGTISGGTSNKDVLAQNKDYFQQPVEVRGGTATISGVTITGGDSFPAKGNGGGAIVAWSTTTVNNVDIDFTGYGIWSDGPVVTVTGESTSVEATGNALFAEEGGTINVSAGDFTGALAVDSDPSSGISLTGGTYDSDVNDFCATGYKATEDAGVWTVTEKKGIDPTDPTSAQEVVIEPTGDADADKETAIAQAEVTVPETAKTLVDETTYKSYFKLQAVETSEGSGVYNVSIVDIADEVKEEVAETAAEAIAANDVDEEGKVTVTVKPGLYYGFDANENLGSLEEPTLTLATGNSVKVLKPGTTKGFIKVKVSTTAE